LWPTRSSKQRQTWQGSLLLPLLLLPLPLLQTHRLLRLKEMPSATVKLRGRSPPRLQPAVRVRRPPARYKQGSKCAAAAPPSFGTPARRVEDVRSASIHGALPRRTPVQQQLLQAARGRRRMAEGTAWMWIGPTADATRWCRPHLCTRALLGTLQTKMWTWIWRRGLETLTTMTVTRLRERARGRVWTPRRLHLQSSTSS
jgi:hypothetical protein